METGAFLMLGGGGNVSDGAYLGQRARIGYGYSERLYENVLLRRAPIDKQLLSFPMWGVAKAQAGGESKSIGKSARRTRERMRLL